ncbi:MAG: MBL fold metallo-hydrolase, partial [Burkholderiaceae bacterium]
MKFASLGSGSDGNALLISAASGATRTTVMLDCGFALRET